MSRARLPSLIPTLLLLALAQSAPVRAADATGEVTIYRCVDSKGGLTLRDTPCKPGERQETRTMLRPKDAPPRPVAPRATRRSDDTLPTRVVMAYPPRPMYECTTPDGERYTSESPEGNPRWVPLWTLGYPVYPVYPRRETGVEFRIGNRNAELRGGSHVIDGPLYPAAAYGAGTWIRDQCHALPPAEVCDRLVDRRDEIRRRFFNAMPSERDVLRVEERGINARLEQDCG